MLGIRLAAFVALLSISATTVRAQDTDLAALQQTMDRQAESLRHWIDWAAEHGVGFLQLLPINETGSDDSPYNAISSVALEPLYLAFEPEHMPGLKPVDVEAAQGELSKALSSRLIDYALVRHNKMMLLRRVLEGAAAPLD